MTRKCKRKVLLEPYGP